MKLQSNNRTDEVGRKNPAAGVHVELGRHNIVLLTVTTKDRSPWVADKDAHEHLHQTWQAATAWLVGDYLLMPDHLHLFCAPHDLAFTIEQWITFWKRDFRRRHGREDWSFNRAAGITDCVTARIIQPSGFMFRKIQSVKIW